MNKEICVVHANCQGEPLIDRLNCCPEFRERYECTLFTNYIREPVPDDILGRASLFLYQHLGDEWESLSSERLRGKLPDSARAFCIPNMVFWGYWPFWYGKPGFDYPDRRLDQLLAMNLPAEEVIALYLRQPIAKHHDVDAVLETTFTREAEREAHTSVKYLEYIREHWRERRLFNTINHPGPELMALAATGVLKGLGFTPPDYAVLHDMGDPFPEFEMPIHPLVAEHFGLAFAGPDTLYEIYGQKMTYAGYVAHYVDCVKSGIEDFIGYLRARAVEAAS